MLILIEYVGLLRCSVICRVPAFQPGSLRTIPGEMRSVSPYPGTGCMSFGCVLSYVVSGGGPDILLTIDSEKGALELMSSILVHGLAPLNASDPRASQL